MATSPPTERTSDADWIARVYGVLIPVKAVAGLLGYPSAKAVRQANERGRLGFRLFPIAGRRGLYANADDVAGYLKSCMPDSKEQPP